MFCFFYSKSFGLFFFENLNENKTNCKKKDKIIIIKRKKTIKNVKICCAPKLGPQFRPGVKFWRMYSEKIIISTIRKYLFMTLFFYKFNHPKAKWLSKQLWESSDSRKKFYKKFFPFFWSYFSIFKIILILTDEKKRENLATLKCTILTESVRSTPYFLLILLVM